MAAPGRSPASRLLPVLYMHHYLHAENIPVAIASASTLTALPILLAMVAGLFVFPMFSLLMPALLLLVPITADGQRLVDSPPTRIFCRWLSALAAITVLVFLLALLASSLDSRWGEWLAYASVLASAATFLAIVVWRLASWRQTTPEFRLACLGSLIQLLIAVTLLQATTASSGRNPMMLLLYCCAGLAIIALIQFAAARYLASPAWRERPLTRALQLATAGLVLLALVPAWPSRWPAMRSASPSPTPTTASRPFGRTMPPDTTVITQPCGSSSLMATPGLHEANHSARPKRCSSHATI